jgi:N-acetylglucosaminyldiphosphoundecaprenol N-acetyl-beta-D-mannosaminyltransferase
MNRAREKPAAGSSIGLLGVTVHRVTWDDLKAAITEAVETDRHWIIAHHNLHSMYLYHHDAGMRSFYSRAELVHVDGMSLILLAKMLGRPLSRSHRLTWLDWIRPLLAEATRRRWRIFYLGSRPGIAERGAKILRREFPGLVLDTAHGYFDVRRDGAENRAVLETINRFRPNLLLVGMGMPRQEEWIAENAEQVRAHVIFSVGALMDYIAGAASTPPRWLGPLGLEWLFRLLSDPARLWKRYLVEPWFVFKLLLLERAGHGRGNGK